MAKRMAIYPGGACLNIILVEFGKCVQFFGHGIGKGNTAFRKGRVRAVGLRITLSEPSFKIVPKGDGIPHVSLAYDFEQIV